MTDNAQHPRFSLTDHGAARLAFGGDYNPEQWPANVWDEDITLMRRAGVTMVTIGVFSWGLIEVADADYRFDWLDDIIERLHAADIAVDLATATATPPAWLVREHPEILPMAADGVVLEYGSRQTYCPSSPVYAEYAVRLAGRLAQRYGHHPAVRLWHINNEYGDHVSACYCSTSSAAFRRWLAGKYGTVDALNEAWGTAHWGQRYSDFEQITAPRRSAAPGNDAQRVDFLRFTSWQIGALVAAEKEAIRRHSDLPVTTNFMSMFHDLDYWSLSEPLDLITDDAYPDPADPKAHVTAAMNYDLMRSLAGERGWLLLESATSAVSWRPVNLPKPPGLMRLWSYQAIARGSDGTMFFQWRAPAFGSEQHHSTMLPAAGPDTRVFDEVRALGSELAQLGELAGSRVTASVAIVLDWDNWWALDAPESMPSDRLTWPSIIRRWYAALFGAGVSVDFVQRTSTAEQLAVYPIVLVPNAYLLPAGTAAALDSYVEQGGRLLVGPFSGVVDDRLHGYPGGAPGPLRQLLGIGVDEVWPLADGATAPVGWADGTESTATTWTEWLREPTDAVEVLARYRTGVLTGRPAATRAHRGSGTAEYLSFVGGEESAIRRLLRSAGFTPGLPDGIERVVRAGAGTSYLFLLNHSGSDSRIRVPAGAEPLIGADKVIDAQLELPPFGVAVLRLNSGADQSAPTTATTGEHR